MLDQIYCRWCSQQLPPAEVRRRDAEARAQRHQLHVCAAMTDVKRPRTVAIGLRPAGGIRVQDLSLAQTLRRITHRLNPCRQGQPEARGQQQTREHATPPRPHADETEPIETLPNEHAIAIEARLLPRHKLCWLAP